MLKVLISFLLIIISFQVLASENTISVDDNCKKLEDKYKQLLKDEIANAATSGDEEALELLFKQKEQIHVNHQVSCLLSKSPITKEQRLELVTLRAKQNEIIETLLELSKTEEEEVDTAKSEVSFTVDDNCEPIAKELENLFAPEITTAAKGSDKSKLEKLQKQKQQIHLNHQINCLLNKSPRSESQEAQLLSLSDKQQELIKPSVKMEKNVDDTHIIAAFELGAMKLPDYSDGENNGFSANKAYFDSYFDGRFDFASGEKKDKGLNLLLNATFIGSFYGSGAVTEPIDEVQSGDSSGEEPKTTAGSNTENLIPTDFNQVSDTFDGSFTLRLSASYCNPNDALGGLSCLFASKNKRSSLGLIYRFGFQNREKRLADADTVNDYRGWGLDYRYYRSDIPVGGNAIPDFMVTYLHDAKFEQYGALEPEENCDPSTTDCLVPRLNAERHVLILNWRLVEDKPYFFGFRVNGGEGQDDYGVTLGIRKNGADLLSFFGAN